MPKYRPSQTLLTDNFRSFAILHSCFHRPLFHPWQLHHLADLPRLGSETCCIYFIGREASPESDADGELTNKITTVYSSAWAAKLLVNQLLKLITSPENQLNIFYFCTTASLFNFTLAQKQRK